MVAGTHWIRGIIEMFGEIWQCKVKGILARKETGKDVHVPKDHVDQINFLGVTIEDKDGELRVHQNNYIINKLDKRGMLKGFGKLTLPIVNGGKLTPGDKESSGCHDRVAQAQTEVGTIQWLAIKTRPDVAAIMSMAASLQTRIPTEALKVTEGIWKYLAATWNAAMSVTFAGHPEGMLEMQVDMDESIYPGGHRSRSGIIIMLNGELIHWASNKQSMSATSSCEAELNACITGVKLAVGIRDVIR